MIPPRYHGSVIPELHTNLADTHQRPPFLHISHKAVTTTSLHESPNSSNNDTIALVLHWFDTSLRSVWLTITRTPNEYSGFKNSLHRWIWIFKYTIGSSHHRFQVDRCVLMRWHQRSYSNDIQDWTGCHHFLEQTYQYSLDLYPPTVINHISC